LTAKIEEHEALQGQQRKQLESLQEALNQQILRNTELDTQVCTVGKELTAAAQEASHLGEKLAVQDAEIVDKAALIDQLKSTLAEHELSSKIQLQEAYQSTERERARAGDLAAQLEKEHQAHGATKTLGDTRSLESSKKMSELEEKLKSLQGLLDEATRESAQTQQQLSDLQRQQQHQQQQHQQQPNEDSEVSSLCLFQCYSRL
jgi:hypothetical protein